MEEVESKIALLRNQEIVADADVALKEPFTFYLLPQVLSPLKE